MNKTKYQPGDKVRVKSDLVKYNKKYYMENNDISRVFVESMSYLKGKIVTINKITSSGTYGIEEEGYSWTDEMFEDIVPEYVECIKPKESYFIKGVIYKVINATNLVSAEVISNIKTGSYNPGNTLYVTLKDSDGKQYYKNSTREAYEAPQKPKTPKFERGKWYKNLGTNGDYIGKFEKLEETRWYCSDHIYKGVHQNYGGNLTHVFENAIECTVEEIQQYLPDGHVDKKIVFKEDEYYTSFNSDGTVWQIFICKSSNDYGSVFTKGYLSTHAKAYFINHSTAVEFNTVTHKVSTLEERQWLDACIKAGKYLTKEEALKPVIKPWGVGSYVVFVHNYGNSYVGDVDRIKTDASMRDRIVVCEKEGITTTNPEFVKWFATLEEAEAFAKTLKPVITVESEMERLGLAVGDKIKFVDEPIEDAYYDGYKFEKLRGLRGEFFTIKGGIVLKNALFVKIGGVDNYVLATAVTKISSKFMLGDYEVTVPNSSTVKIGCTELNLDNVIGLLDDFIQISDKFGANEHDIIFINKVKVNREIADKLLSFINQC